MEKQTHVEHADCPCTALLLSDVPDNELEFFRRFASRHGGAVVPVGHHGWYRLDLPPGTQQLPNDEDDLLMRETYRLLYPDGTSLIWYRQFVLDGVLHASTLLAPQEDDDGPVLASGEEEKARM
jgi:hypothetical protein